MAARTMARVVWKPRESSPSSSAPAAASVMTKRGPRIQLRRPARLKRSQKAFHRASRQSSINSARSPPATTPRSTRRQRLARRGSQRLRNSWRTAVGARRPAIHTRQRYSVGGGSPSSWVIKVSSNPFDAGFPYHVPRAQTARYGISHIHLHAAGTSQERRRTGAVARFRTPPAATGGADSLQAEPANTGVLRGGRPGAGDLPAGLSRYRELHVSIARQLPALAFGHRRPRHRRPRAVPEPGAVDD